MSDFTFIFFVVLAVLLVLLLLSIRIVPEGYQYLLVRLGKKKVCLDPGLHFTVPFIEWIHSKVNIRERTMIFEDLPSQTKDNIVLLVSSSMTYKIQNSESSIYNVVNVHQNLKLLSEQLLGGIFRDCLLEDDLLEKIDSQRNEIFQTLHVTAERWGIVLNDFGPIQYKLPAELAADVVRLKQVKAEADAAKYAVIQQVEGKRLQHSLIVEGKEREAEKEKILLEHIRETISVLENTSADSKIFILPIAGASAGDELMKVALPLNGNENPVNKQEKPIDAFQDKSGSSDTNNKTDSSKGDSVKGGLLDPGAKSALAKIQRPIDPDAADKKMRSMIGTDSGDETFIGLQAIDKNSLSKLEESMTYACDDTQDF